MTIIKPIAREPLSCTDVFGRLLGSFYLQLLDFESTVVAGLFGRVFLWIAVLAAHENRNIVDFSSRLEYPEGIFHIWTPRSMSDFK